MSTLKVRFAKTVRRLRTEAGFSQESFAAEAKINRSYYGLIERGGVNVSLENIEKITKALKVTVGQLMTEVDRDR